jgi:hypothetical protein
MKPGDSYGFFLRSLRKFMEKYEGEYVAIVGGEIVAHGTDGKKVYDRARRVNPESKMLLGQVPMREAMVLWLWLDPVLEAEMLSPRSYPSPLLA